MNSALLSHEADRGVRTQCFTILFQVSAARIGPRLFFFLISALGLLLMEISSRLLLTG